jgi:cytochrome c oxidase subunit 3
MFYLLSGLHGVHVFGGILMLALLTIRASRNYFNIKRKNYVAVTGIYWHFVTALWLLLFLILFVI